MDDEIIESQSGGVLRTTRNVLSILVGVGMMAISAFDTPVRQWFVRLYEKMPEWGKVTAFFVCLALVLILTLFAGFSFAERRRRKQKVKALESNLDELRKKNKELNAELIGLRPIQDELVASKKENIQLKKKLTICNKSVDLATSEGIIWDRHDVKSEPPFQKITHRPTRFVTVLNLKGGVGKTFLTANLAATLKLTDKPWRWQGKILLVDLDFQSTLSEGAILSQQLKMLRKGNKDSSLLHTSNPLTMSELHGMSAPMNGVPGIDIIPSDNRLDKIDFQSANLHLLTGKENRFDFRLHFHQSWFYDEYSLVVFDCPPRLTASTIMALTCSDYFIIPTRPESHSVYAVENTFRQLSELTKINIPDLLAIVPNELKPSGESWIKAHQEAIADLATYIRKNVDPNALVPDEAAIREIPAGAQPPIENFDTVWATDPKIRGYLEPLASEIAKRLQKQESYAIQSIV